MSCRNTVPLPQEWSISSSTANSRPRDPLTATGDADIEPPISPAPAPPMDFLQELEEAASSLQSTPMYATPRASPYNPFSNSHMDPPQSSTPASLYAAAEGDTQTASVAHFAQLQWSALHAGLSVRAARLDTMRVWLQEASLRCAMPAPAMDIQLDQRGAVKRRGSAVMRDAFRLQAASGIEHSALQDSQGQPLACHIQWKPGITEQQLSIHVGTITVVHVPGLLTDICTFAGLLTPSPEGESDAGTDSFAAAETGRASWAASESSVPQPSLVVSVSVLGIALGALSSVESPLHAVWLISSRLSMHLGQIRARGRPGSLSAGLLAVQKPSALPSTGLRVSAMGVQLGIVPHWQDAVDPSTLWPLGAQAVNEPIEVQALVQGWPLLQGPARAQPPRYVEPHMPQQQPTLTAWPSAPVWQSSGSGSNSSSSSMQATPASHGPQSRQARTEAIDLTMKASRLISVAGSALDLHLTGYQLAIMASVADAITAEISRRFQQALPQQAIPPGSESEASMEAWLGCLSMQTTATFAMLTLDQDLDSVLANIPSGLKAAAAAAASDAHQGSTDTALGRSELPSRQVSAPAVAVICDQLVVTVAVGSLGTAMPAVSITLAEPHMWGSWGSSNPSHAPPATPSEHPLTTFHACLPACDMHTAVVSIPAQPQMTPERLPLRSSPQMHTVSMQVQQQWPAQAVDPILTAPAVAPQQSPSIMKIGSPFAVISTIDMAVAASSSSTSLQGSPDVTINVQSVSFDWQSCHISPLVQFLQCTTLGPAIPVLPSYPPSTQPQGSRINVEMEVQMLFGQVLIV